PTGSPRRCSPPTGESSPQAAPPEALRPRRCISSRLGDCPNVEVTVPEGRYRGWGRRRTRSVGLQRGREARRWPGEPRVAVSTGGCRPAPAHEALFGQRLLHRTRCRLPSPTLPPRSAVELRA